MSVHLVPSPYSVLAMWDRGVPFLDLIGIGRRFGAPFGRLGRMRGNRGREPASDDTLGA